MPISKIDTLYSLVGYSNKDIGMIIYVYNKLVDISSKYKITVKQHIKEGIKLPLSSVNRLNRLITARHSSCTVECMHSGVDRLDRLCMWVLQDGSFYFSSSLLFFVVSMYVCDCLFVLLSIMGRQLDRESWYTVKDSLTCQPGSQGQAAVSSVFYCFLVFTAFALGFLVFLTSLGLLIFLIFAVTFKNPIWYGINFCIRPFGLFNFCSNF